MRRLALVTAIALSLLSLYAASARADGLDYQGYLHVVGDAALPDIGRDVALSGQYAYVANAQAGVQVVDLSDPGHPEIIYTVPTGAASGIAIAGPYAYVANLGSVEVIDISVPQSAHVVGTVPVPDWAWDVAYADGYAYIADYVGGFQVVDVREPSAPQLVSGIDSLQVASVAVSGSVVYAADLQRGLVVIDVTVPSDPKVVGQIAVPMEARGVAVSGNRVYIGDSGLQIIDVSDPAAPRLLGRVDYGDWYGVGAVAVSGRYAYLACAGYGIRVIDVDNPDAPRESGSIRAADEAVNIAVEGDFAAVVSSQHYADGYNGLYVIDVSNPESPSPIGGLQAPGGPLDVEVSGNLAYVANYASGLQVIDVTDPSNPRPVGGAGTPGDANRVKVVANYAYVADSESGIDIMDVSNPEDVQVVGRFMTPGNAAGLAAANQFIYSAGGGWLRVTDVSDPQAPVQCGALGLPGYANGIALSGNLAYIVGTRSYPEYDGFLSVVNLSDPANPLLTETVSVDPAFSVTVSNGCLFVGTDGLQIVSQYGLYLLGQVDLPGSYSYDLAKSGNYLYLANNSPYNGSMYVVDVTSCSSPRVIGGADMPEFNYASGIAESDGSVYVAALGAGLQIWPAQCTTSDAAEGSASSAALGLRVFPNPAFGSAAIRLTTPQAGPVRLTVYDAAGRRIRGLEQAFVPAGIRDIAWDGRDERGRLVAPGIYLVRANCGAKIANTRVTLLR